MPAEAVPPAGEHLVSVVIPIYQAEHQLPSVLADLVPLTEHVLSPGGAPYRVTEVLLVHDCGPDDSARVLRELEAEHPFVRPIWLSRNFGQHAATLAGMSSSGGDWIVTMDEDGQHDPAYIGAMLDVALDRAGQRGLRQAQQRRTARRAAQRRSRRRQAPGHALSGGPTPRRSTASA